PCDELLTVVRSRGESPGGCYRLARQPGIAGPERLCDAGHPFLRCLLESRCGHRAKHDGSRFERDRFIQSEAAEQVLDRFRLREPREVALEGRSVRGGKAPRTQPFAEEVDERIGPLGVVAHDPVHSFTELWDLGYRGGDEILDLGWGNRPRTGAIMATV